MQTLEDQIVRRALKRFVHGAYNDAILATIELQSAREVVWLHQHESDVSNRLNECHRLATELQAHLQALRFSVE